MAHQTITSKVTIRANKLAAKFGRRNAFIMAWAAEKLIAQMQNSECVEFQFVKADNTIRDAKGTRMMPVIEKHWTPVGTTYNKPEVVRFFDVEINEWRSFRIDRLAA